MNRYFLKHLPHKNHGQLYMHLVSRFARSQFFRQFSQDFQTFDIFITLKHLASSKKPLACELLHALSESIFALLYAGNHTPPCHQTAIFWAEYQYEKNSNLVGTQQQFRFVSSDLNPQKLTNLLRDHLDILASQNFHQRLLTQLQQNQAKLSPAELFKASGHLVGAKYWQTIASQDLVEIFAAIKQNLSVEIAEM